MTRALPRAPRDDGAAGTFTPNQRLPVHRWFRFSAGFSGAWAEEVIREHAPPGGLVLDPFAGCGTTLVAADAARVRSLGVEAHPFVADVASAKLGWWVDGERLRRHTERVLALAGTEGEPAREPEGGLLARIYDPEALSGLRRLQGALARARAAAPEVRALAWLALVAILRTCSHAGTAPWQYVLPRRSRRRVADPREAYRAQVGRMLEDVVTFAGRAAPGARVLRGDARELAGVADRSVDLVVTSPPYPNNFDYADATRVELTFLGEVSTWADLQGAVRRRLVRSCSQHAAAERIDAAALLRSPLLAPIAAELGRACEALAELRRARAGRKTYDGMIAAYFADLALVWRALGRVVRPGGRVCLVVGDSAPYGVHLPVEAWLARLAEPHGFRLERFEETRARNVKWRNRKHRVPLHEGRLWLARTCRA